jgi:hypothetical protein
MNLTTMQVLAFLFVQPNKTSDFATLFSAMQTDGAIPGKTPSDFGTDLTAYAATGILSYNDVTGAVVGLVDPVVYATMDDTDVPANVNLGLQELADAIGGASLAAFLVDLRADGRNTPDVIVAVRVLSRVALITAAKLNSDKLRAPLFRAARIADDLATVMTTNP